tara:strand:- start:663 stop:2429 length:1767 start_codon:yes stop_codon:yes gene_type:complete
MSAYDNPKLINDKSALAWAAAAQQVTQAVVTGYQNYVDFKIKNAETAKKKQEVFDLAWNEASLKAYENADKIYEDVEDAGLEDSIIDQAKKIQVGLMEGVGKPGDDDYVMGSIEAQTILQTRGGLTKKQRKEYSDKVSAANKNLRDLQDDAGIILSDVQDVELYKDGPGPGRESNWEGGNFQEQLGTQLAAFGLSNISAEGMTVDSKDYRRLSNGDRVVEVVTTVAKGSKILKGGFGEGGWLTQAKNKDANNTYKVNEDGSVTFTWKKNMKNWDGQLLKATEAATDGNQTLVDANILDKSKGEITASFKTAWTPVGDTIGTDAGKVRTLVASEFIDMKGIDKSLEKQLEGRLAGLYALPPRDKKAYMEQRLEMGDININEFVQLTEEQQKSWLRLAEINKIREDAGLTSTMNIDQLMASTNPDTNKKYTREEAEDEVGETPGFGFVRRELTDDDIKQLKERGLTNYKAGEYGYFKESDPSISYAPQGNRGLTAAQQTALSNKNAQVNRFENTNFRGDIFSAAMSGRLSKPKASDRKIMSFGDSWKPMIWVTSSVDGVTGAGAWVPTKHNGKASFTNDERVQLTDYVDL